MPVRTEISGAIARIIFSDPKANSLSSTSLREVELALRALAREPSIRAVGLESEGGGAFSAGASFDELKSLQSESAARDFFGGFGRVVLAMRDLPKFVVVRAHGKSVGGALGLLAAADFVLASPAAEVRLSELSIGIGPFVVGPVVERKIGRGAFQALTVDTGWRSAEWAERHGLYAKVIPAAELQSEYDKELGRIASLAPHAVSEVKKIFWEDSAGLEATISERASTVAKLLLNASIP